MYLFGYLPSKVPTTLKRTISVSLLKQRILILAKGLLLTGDIEVRI